MLLFGHIVLAEAVSKWESGASDPSTSNLLALAKLYGVSAEDLLREAAGEWTSPMPSPMRGRWHGGAVTDKVTSIWISTIPSIDGSRSKATSYKFDTPVSGGAYQDAREVTLVWNDA